ncbi:MAG: transcription elongation factor GreA [Bacteroidia bacterium]
MKDAIYFTKEGLEKLKQEIHHLTTKERPAISKQIAEAREKGDLSENAEYDAAKDAQGMLEMKIAKLEGILGNARILDEKNIDTSKVMILSTVHLRNMRSGKNTKYKLVSENEADLKQGKISVQSPIGKGLLGRKRGEVVEINVPAGVLSFEILDITIE